MSLFHDLSFLAFFFSDAKKYSRFILCLHCPKSGISHISKKERFLSVGKDKDKEKDGENSLLTGETEFISKPG